MLTWDGTLNSYKREVVNVLTDNMGITGIGNMMPNNKDMPTFYHTGDGHIRELDFGNVLSRSSFFGPYTIPFTSLNTLPCGIQYQGNEVNILPRLRK